MNEQTTETRLDPERVETVLRDCLFRDGEAQEPRVEVEGIVSRFGFHPERLAGHKEEIVALLAELPEQFMQSAGESGGGWSFLNACMDRHGNQWTGLHRTMEHLFVLGEGVGAAKPLLPREMWSVMPGRMPYYVVLDGPHEAREVGE